MTSGQADDNDNQQTTATTAGLGSAVMRPHYEDDACTMYRGDSMRVLAALPDNSVDAVITDPPYSSGGFTRGDRALSTTGSKYTDADSIRQLADFAGDNRDQRGYAFWCSLWLAECLRVTKPGGVVALFTDWRQLPVTTDALQSGGWVWRGVVPWYKPSSRPMAGRFTSACEYVVWGSSGSMGRKEAQLMSVEKGDQPDLFGGVA